MNRSHESFLVPFFKEMNSQFKGQWCVLHSYETLPFFSESDVDMAFSGKNSVDLKHLINSVARETGWALLQKFWYDAQQCSYYVLRHDKSDTLLAIDFLIDNDGIGKYGFTTKILTGDCVLVDDCFPIPNHETALCYKLVKRIVKQRSLREDQAYLEKQYAAANKDNVKSILSSQFGEQGTELILRYLSDKNEVLDIEDITLLHHIRKKKLATFRNRIKFWFWANQRIFNRILYPSGFYIKVPYLTHEELELLADILENKMDIIFRFVKLNKSNSLITSIIGFVGSTLVICPRKDSHEVSINYTWQHSEKISLKSATSNSLDKVDIIAKFLCPRIIELLASRMVNR